MASKGGWVGSQEKFGWVCTAFEPLLCLKIIYFTTLLKTRDLFSQPIHVHNYVIFNTQTANVHTHLCFHSKMLKSEIINPVWDSKPPKPYPVQRHWTSLGHIRECSTCIIQVAPNIWVPKLHTQGVYLSLCGIMALLWRKSYNSTHYLQVHFLFSYFEYCKYRRQRKVSNNQFSWVSYDCTAFKEFPSKYLSSLIIS